VDVKRVGRELGVLYVLEVSVRKAGNRIRITAQLLYATIGGHLWADHFDGSLEDVFEPQDNVASYVAGVIEPTLKVAEQRRSTQRPTTDLTTYDLYLRANAGDPHTPPRRRRALTARRHLHGIDPATPVVLQQFVHDAVAVVNQWRWARMFSRVPLPDKYFLYLHTLLLRLIDSNV
jgi:hypothetical protein